MENIIKTVDKIRKKIIAAIARVRKAWRTWKAWKACSKKLKY